MSALSENQWSFFMRLAGRIVPESVRLDDAGKQDFRDIVDGALSARPAKVRRQFGMLLAILRWLPMLRYGAPLDRLSPARQDAALGWFQDAPLMALRKGMWGLKAMVFMGYYGRPEGAAAVGYAPSFDGNAELARGAAPGSSP